MLFRSAVVIAGYLVGISRIEWCMIVLACAAVWTAEALNTAFEHLADATTKEFHQVIGQAKGRSFVPDVLAQYGICLGLDLDFPHLQKQLGKLFDFHWANEILSSQLKLLNLS